MKGVRVTKFVKGVRFECVWVGWNRGVGGQSVSGYLGLVLVFVWGDALREGGGLNRFFGGFFASVGWAFILAGGLGGGLLFYGVWTLS